MKKKNGFTLVELLAIVIVLAILALIIVPSTLSIIRSVRKNALKDSAYGLIGAAKNYFALKGDEMDYTIFEFKDGEQISTEKLQYKGKINGNGMLALTSNGEIAVCIASGKYYASKKTTDKEVTVSSASGDVECTLPEDNADNFEVTINSGQSATKKTNCESNVIPESKKYKEDILHGAYPELYQGMIPVEISKGGVVSIADITKKWYSYKEHKWANAVVINYNNKQIASKYFNNDMTIRSDMIGKEIQDDDILQYYVWIPRYKYKLWNSENDISTMQNIDIKFESNKISPSLGKLNGEYLTHPAFTFDGKELNGFWMGKYEVTSWPSATAKLTIRPNFASARSIIVLTAFEHTRGMDTNYPYLYGFNSSEMDSHLTKNMEWGAMTYLTYSKYGRYDYTEDDKDLATTCSAGGDCRVWVNCNNSYITGCACATVTAGGAAVCNKWNTALGVHASTTDNTSGVYDVSGGSWDAVMGNMYGLNETFLPHSSGFILIPDSKYIDMYAYSVTVHSAGRGKLGDATREILSIKDNTAGGWSGTRTEFAYSGSAWFVRGGRMDGGTTTGPTNYGYYSGTSDSTVAYRVTITRES